MTFFPHNFIEYSHEQHSEICKILCRPSQHACFDNSSNPEKTFLRNQ